MEYGIKLRRDLKEFYLPSVLCVDEVDLDLGGEWRVDCAGLIDLCLIFRLGFRGI